VKNDVFSDILKGNTS